MFVHRLEIWRYSNRQVGVENSNRVLPCLFVLLEIAPKRPVVQLARPVAE